MSCIEKFDGFKQWGPGNNGNPELNIINHHKKHVIDGIDNGENWQEHLDCLDLESYRDFALKKSKCMTNKTVHTNGHRVYLCGIYKNVLIIGRLDENDQLGISSCYIIHEHLFEKKLAAFKKNSCFSF